MTKKWIIATATVALAALVGAFYAGRGYGYDKGKREGFDQAAREIRCDGGGHIPNPWKKDGKK